MVIASRWTSVGDTVLFAKYAGTEFKFEEEEYLILSEKDILAKVDDKSASTLPVLQILWQMNGGLPWQK